ncbi:MAG: GGDEF domain-containing phosphodiesterase [Lachnospiraceae bacterium]|nr:GGDEF domain-containing phosphodiesterase [Lachnospiraceae bacterium]
MASKSEKKYRKIKRTHIVGSLIWFILFAAISACIIVAAVQMLLAYVIDTKISSEYESLEYMAKLYENGKAAGNEDIYAILNEEGHGYVITGNDGNVIYANGENTISSEGGPVTLPVKDEQVLVYRDTERGYVFPSNSGRLALDLNAFRKWMSSDLDIEEKDPEFIDVNNSILNLPIWISFDAGEGEHFIGKAIFRANRRDSIMFVTLIAVIAVLIVVILIAMLTEAIKSFVRQRRMLDLFFKDMVTGGHNWTWFLVKGEQLLKKRIHSNDKYAVVNLVFVNYRNYCMCHSVAEGEKLLVSVYKKINSYIGSREMCAHTTSSNFAILLKCSDELEAGERLKRLIGSLETIDPDHKFSFQAGAFIIDMEKGLGGRRFTKDDIDLDTAYNNASTARTTLDDNDDSGIAFFDEKLMEEHKWLDTVQERQQAALDNEEFLVYYQPKYDPRTNELKGAEALIRWNSPEFGIVPPGRFIPIFEKNGFITKIDHYMIKHVARDQKNWLDKGFKCVPVSVNVSRAHFVENDLADQIRNMVDEAGTPHEYIEIELTESAFFDDKRAMIRTINKLKEYGFAVSMDDFGSGYSSLNSLKDMPLDVLKLDAEFFRDENAGRRGEIVVSEAIKLAKNLNMRIVAEGVEVRDQVDFLAGEGCDMIQGYFFAKPMPGDKYEEKMAEGKAEISQAEADVSAP